MQDLDDILAQLAEKISPSRSALGNPVSGPRKPGIRLTKLRAVELAVNPGEPDDWLTEKKILKLDWSEFSGATLLQAIGRAAEHMRSTRVIAKKPPQNHRHLQQ